MFKISDFTKPQLDRLLEDGNLTERERTLVELRNREIPLEQCAEMMDMSKSTVNRAVGSLLKKARRLGLVGD